MPQPPAEEMSCGAFGRRADKPSNTIGPPPVGDEELRAFLTGVRPYVCWLHPPNHHKIWIVSADLKNLTGPILVKNPRDEGAGFEHCHEVIPLPTYESCGQSQEQSMRGIHRGNPQGGSVEGSSMPRLTLHSKTKRGPDNRTGKSRLLPCRRPPGVVAPPPNDAPMICVWGGESSGWQCGIEFETCDDLGRGVTESSFDRRGGGADRTAPPRVG